MCTRFGVLDFEGMECGSVAKPSKSFSYITEIVSGFARVCRFRSVGVFSTDNPGHNRHDYSLRDGGAVMGEDCSDATEEAERDAEKVHPHPVEGLSGSGECVSGNVGIFKLFDTVSALKLAYIQLQRAHLPYDPEKIKAANELVVAEVEALCKIKRAYKEKKHLGKTKLGSSHSQLIRVKEELLEELKSQATAKDSEILSLRRQLDDLDLKNTELTFKLEWRCLEEGKVGVFNRPSFQDAFNAASKAIHDFAKPLISFLRVSGWDLDLAANSIEEDAVVYSKRCHKKYAFEAYIARRMFHGISIGSYNFGYGAGFDDPVGALIEDPDSGFAEFCRSKYLLIVHPKMEASFFGNLDHRMLVTRGKHPRTPFYEAFVKMANCVWILLGIATSVKPKAEIFGVKRGTEFSKVYMQCVEEGDKGATDGVDEGQTRLKVEFMVMPGFRIGDTLVKSQVYLSKMRS